jgi:hypothetical protein
VYRWLNPRCDRTNFFNCSFSHYSCNIFFQFAAVKYMRYLIELLTWKSEYPRFVLP